MADDVTVVRDVRETHPDGTIVRVRVLAVPESERFLKGVKYAFHYGTRDGATIVRVDDHHGPHELHLLGATLPVEFPGLPGLYDAWLTALPPEKRPAD